MTDEQRAELAADKRKMLMHMEEEIYDQEDVVSLMNVMLLNNKINKRNGLSDDRLYLTNCSTVTAVKNKDLLKNIRRMEHELNVSCNTGVAKANQIGKLGKLQCWYKSDGIANILFQHQVEKKYRVIYDNWDGYYVVHHTTGAVKFCKDHQGLPYIDMVYSSYKAAILIVQTVHGNYAEVFTKKEVLQTKQARCQQGIMGMMSEKITGAW